MVSISAKFVLLAFAMMAVVALSSCADEDIVPTTDASVTAQPKDSRIFGPGGKGWRHFLLPFLMGVTLKVSTLVPVILMVMTILGGATLLVSKMALLFAAITAGHQFFIKTESAPKHQPELMAAHVYPIPSLDQDGHGSSGDYQQYSNYPSGYAGSYNPYAGQHYRRVIYNRR